jgi:RNA polymerase sigma-70 factor (ECF subfamily)
VNDRQLDDDTVLATRAQQGDQAAFATLVRRHASNAHRAAFLITRSSADADDALQDGTVKAFYNLHRFDPVRPFRPWFVTIVANTARNRARSRSRRDALALRVMTVDPPSDPADDAVASEERGRLLHHLEALPDKLRSPVALRHVLGLSERETAAALGIRLGTVKSRVSRGLELLRQAMRGDSA